ncbi:hypothetical protein GCM10010343_58580 [Streptomyces avidinii]|nr:hypothetical protein GCM10010343_58580 [Streptomyces avidinii]
MLPLVERQDLHRDVRTRSHHVQQMFQLHREGRATPDPAAKHCLVQDDPELWRRLTSEYCLPSYPSLDHAL